MIGSVLQLIAETQREIHVTLSGYLSSFANERNWLTLLAVLPMGMVFGAIHALMPGHSKTVIATYLAGSPIGYLRGMLTSFALSFTHVTMAVLIAVLGLPLVSEIAGEDLHGLFDAWLYTEALPDLPEFAAA